MYEWDDNKRRTNLVKHGVDFSDIDRFEWHTALVATDPRHVEPRWRALGFIGNRLHALVYSDAIRIISLRKANTREMKHYAQTKKKGHIWPTAEEEVQINAGIAADPDNPELTEDFFKRAKRGRGPQKSPTKERVSIRLDADIASHFRDTGPGWQSRLNDTLRRVVFGN